jgi:rod shape-determining protein MreD
MNAALKWTSLFLVCLIAQASLVPALAVAGVGPDLPFIILYFFALQFGITPSIYAGFFLGLFQDLYSPSLLGQNALSKTIAGAFTGIFNERMMRTDPVIKAVILLASFALHDLVFVLARGLSVPNLGGRIVHQLVFETTGRALYSLVPAALIYLWNAYGRHPLGKR